MPKLTSSKNGSLVPWRKVGRMLRERRRELHLRQVDVTTKTGLAATTMSELENGKRESNRVTLQSVARVLSMDPAPLFRLVGFPTETVVLESTQVGVADAVRRLATAKPEDRARLLASVSRAHAADAITALMEHLKGGG